MQKGLAAATIIIGTLIAGVIIVGAWYTRIIQIPNLPPPGCRYQQVRCIQAPCNPALVCGDLMLKLRTPSPDKDKQNRGDCRITGCSGQVCSDKEVVTTCEMLPQYGCYRKATCERQASGQCGWTQTEELTKCLKQF